MDGEQAEDTSLIEHPTAQVIQRHTESAINWRERRHDDWNENYMLYRDKVIINRLTQRQSVNVPLMKYALKTLLKDIDEPPNLFFESIDNDEQAQVFFNEVWKYMARYNKLIVKDIIDKKQVLLFGRSFKKLNIVDGKFYFEIIDPQDILVDRYVDPANIDTARFFSQIHIYRPLATLEKNAMYDQEAVLRLKKFYGSAQGLLKAQTTAREMQDKSKRMQQLGVVDVDSPILGETYVELSENFLYKFDNKKNCELLHFIVKVDTEVLCDLPLYEVIGDTSDDFWFDHIPFTSWADDPERTDFWSDSVADSLRTSNKILNSWISQLVENRTLRNFGMNYYNSTVDGFAPQTYTPTPWGWYPLPGKPDDMVKHVDVPDLSESLDEMQFIIGLAEKASSATNTAQGAVEKQNVTLGEVQLALANAKERVKSMAVFYNQDWEDFGVKYTKMLEAASDMMDDVKITKKGRLGLKMYTRTIKPQEWLTAQGYTVDVQQMADKQNRDIERIQKLNAARSVMQGNKPLDKIYKKKLLDFAELSLSEQQQVMDFEKQTDQAMLAAEAAVNANGGAGAPGAPTAPPPGTGAVAAVPPTNGATNGAGGMPAAMGA